MKKNLTTVLFLICLSLQALAQIIHIPSDYSTIQAGINTASNGDTVLVAEGLYYENINFKGKAITVASQFLLDGDTSHISKTVIDGSKPNNSDSASVVNMEYCPDTTAVLTGFSITGGTGTKHTDGDYLNNMGGGIYMRISGKVEFNKVFGNNAVLSGNGKKSVYGGGIVNFAADGTHCILVVRNNWFYENYIESNTFTVGGGVCLSLHNGTLIFENNSVSQNTAKCLGTYTAHGGGAAFYSANPWQANLLIRRNTILDNKVRGVASQGGGLFLSYPRFPIPFVDGKSKIVIYNNLIANNESEDIGGGISIWDQNKYGSKWLSPVPVIYNNTIVNNKANDGAGIHNFGAKVLYFNNIIWNDLSIEGCREINDDDLTYTHHVINNGIIHTQYNCIQNGYPGVGNIDTDPLFQSDTILLSDGSPCVGTGIDSVEVEGTWYKAPSYDFNDSIRPSTADHYVDLGAIESPYGKWDSPTIVNVPGEEQTIQAAINAASDGDTVLVAEGLYYENINFKGKAITVASHFLMDADTSHISLTIIDGSKPAHPDSASTVNLFGCKDTTSILKGLTITGGKGTKDAHPTKQFIVGGAGIVMDGGKIENNIVTRNCIKTTYYTVGGGIATRPYDPNINVIIRGNHVSNNIVESTDMAQGGGIYADSQNGETLVENNIIIKNSATCTGIYKANGGGIMMASNKPWVATLIVRNNLINENEIHCIASHGGGIFLTFPSLDSYKSNITGIQIYNNIIANNYSQDRGGGIAIWDQLNGAYAINHPNPLIYNNTIVGNTANEAGGIFNFGMNALLMNNIISNNSSSTVAPEISLEDINYNNHNTNHGRFQSFNNNIQGGYPGIGNINHDPQLNTDFSLMNGSPCIGTGIDSVKVTDEWYYAPKFDFFGKNRLLIADTKIDLGAIESPFATSDRATLIHIPREFPTIQEGINSASDGDTVLVAEGLYYENINFKGKAITVASHFLMDGDTSHISLTIIDGSKPSHPDTASVVLFISGEDSTSVLNGFTITGGTGVFMQKYNARGGGGILIQQSGATIENNIICRNKIVSTNTSVGGGGIGSEITGQNIIIRNNIICKNQLSSSNMTMGAGIYLDGYTGYAVIENNKIYQNIVTCTSTYKAIGGGVYIHKVYANPVKITIKNNSIHHNELHCKSTMGGGIYVVFSREITNEDLSNYTPIEITNNIITDNISPDKGGGIGVWNMCMVKGNLLQTVPDPIISNNTLINNKASDGAGIFNYDANTVLINNILWDSIPDENCREIFNYDFQPREYCFPNPLGWCVDMNRGLLKAYNNVIKGGWQNIGTKWVGENNIDDDPILDPETFELSANSPCVGAGIDSVEVEGTWYKAPSYDFNDSIRPYTADHYVDLGAIESSFEISNALPDTKSDEGVLQVYPNPTSGKVSVHFNVDKKQAVKLGIYNVLGQQEVSLLNEVRAPGTYEVEVAISALRNGVYFMVLESNTKTTTKLIKQ